MPATTSLRTPLNKQYVQGYHLLKCRWCGYSQTMTRQSDQGAGEKKRGGHAKNRQARSLAPSKKGSSRAVAEGIRQTPTIDQLAHARISLLLFFLLYFSVQSLCFDFDLWLFAFVSFGCSLTPHGCTIVQSNYSFAPIRPPAYYSTTCTTISYCAVLYILRTLTSPYLLHPSIAGIFRLGPAPPQPLPLYLHLSSTLRPSHPSHPRPRLLHPHAQPLLIHTHRQAICLICLF